MDVPVICYLLSDDIQCDRVQVELIG